VFSPRRFIVGCLVLLVVPVWVGWKQDGAARVQERRPTRSGWCPNEPYQDSEGEVHHRPDSIRIALAEQTQSIPEYHDCQRLLTRDLAFGPLVGIWARDRIDALVHADYKTPIPVGELYNFSPETYPALGIGVGYNCLYMQYNGSNRTWEAFVLYNGTTPTCPTGLPSGVRITKLEVKVQNNSAGQAPPAARWDMDPRSNIHYMGIWCPDGWCEIGRRGFTPSAEYPGTKEFRVKGWYDEQYLTVFDQATQQLRPSTIRGRTIPAPNLDKLVQKDFECWYCSKGRGFVKVATLMIEKDSANYYSNKLNVHRGAPSHVFIRRNRLLNRWEGRIDNPDQRVSRKTIRIDHSDVRVPGTSRWHFVNMDETVWIRCDDGCCDVRGLQ
jgi:hypothetical protein